MLYKWSLNKYSRSYDNIIDQYSCNDEKNNTIRHILHDAYNRDGLSDGSLVSFVDRSNENGLCLIVVADDRIQLKVILKKNGSETDYILVFIYKLTPRSICFFLKQYLINIKCLLGQIFWGLDICVRTLN